MYNDDNIKTIDNKTINNKTIDEKISIKKNNKVISKTIKLTPYLICNGKCNKCDDINNCF